MLSVRRVNGENKDSVFQLWQRVFVDEQKICSVCIFNGQSELEVPYWDVILDIDGLEVGTGRLMQVTKNVARILRICVLEEYRNKKLGARIINELEQIALENDFNATLLLAQYELKGYYLKYEYHDFSGIVADYGLPHVWMLKDLS